MAKAKGSGSEPLALDEPAHWLYVGVTQTGKTTLARFHARKLAGAGHRIIVYDPVGTETAGGGWPEDSELIDDPLKFGKALKNREDAYVFVDEGADVFNQSETQNQWMLRKGRHKLLYFRVMAQRPKMLAPNVRTNCARCFMFRLAKDDAREISADFGHGPDIYNETLDTGDCIMLTSGSEHTESFNVFDLVPATRRKE
jgi:DNA helicase HerA-like ATPase